MDTKSSAVLHGQIGLRNVLVVGSQCLGLAKLSFVAEAAEELYTLMTEPDVCNCHPGLPNRSGLLIDPTVAEMQDAIKEAFRFASERQAMLFLAFIGHGAVVGQEFYLLPKNGNPNTPAEPGASLDLIRVIQGLEAHHTLKGLVLLLDSCHSGYGAIALNRCQTADFRFRYDVLTSTGTQKAYNGCFTRSIVRCLNEGIPTVFFDHLRCEHLRLEIEKNCPGQIPDQVVRLPGPDMFVGRNKARTREATANTRLRLFIEDLVQFYVPTTELSETLKACEEHRCVAVIGEPGTGKSALIASLSEIGATGGFAQAIAFASVTQSSEEIADSLAEQIRTKVPGYEAAWALYRYQSRNEWDEIDALSQKVIGPLNSLETHQPVYLAIDGLDHLDHETRLHINNHINSLVAEKSSSKIRFIVTCRRGDYAPEGSYKIGLRISPEESCQQYLESRKVPSQVWTIIIQQAHGNWLLTKLLADLALKSVEPVEAILSTDNIYDRILCSALQEDGMWATDSKSILPALACAGIGPILPLALLCSASGYLGGPTEVSHIAKSLSLIRSILVWGHAGTPDEHVGLFHSTFEDYLLNVSSRWKVAEIDGHRAIVAALEILAPMEEHDSNNNLHRYAASAEANHLWKLGQYSRLVESLGYRSSAIPAENIERCSVWRDRMLTTLGPDNLESIKLRFLIARYTGEAGNMGEALQLSKVLLDDTRLVLGPDHPYTIKCRAAIARWTGDLGYASKALDLFTELQIDAERILGPLAPITINIHIHVARWTFETGNVSEALQLFTRILPHSKQILGSHSTDSLTILAFIARCKGHKGNYLEALELCEVLLPIFRKVMGPDHPETLSMRGWVAEWTGYVGEWHESLSLFNSILPDSIRVLGEEHRDTLRVLTHIAYYTSKIGLIRESLQLYTAVLSKWELFYGADYPDAIVTRAEIARITAEMGKSHDALRLFKNLLDDSVAVFGSDHNNTLQIRIAIASLIGEIGRAGEARDQLAMVKRHAEKVFGVDHPITLDARSHLARWIGEAGDASEALFQFQILSDDMKRSRGVEHPDTLEIGYQIARWTEHLGEPAKALKLFTGFLSESETILGSNNQYIRWTKEAIARLSKHLD